MELLLEPRSSSLVRIGKIVLERYGFGWTYSIIIVIFFTGDVSDDAVKGEDCIIVGAPTWHTGEDECRSGTAWDEWLYDTLPNLGLEGKKVAIFGCGDQQSYSDYYCDAAGELYDQFTAAGAKVYGMTSTEGYEHVESKAEVEDGKFCGLMFDEDNQYDMSEDRAKNWVAQLKEEGFF